MYYCFINEDVNGLDEHDPLNIQMRYADRIDRLLLCDVEKGIVTDNKLKTVSVKGKDIFLRGTCENRLEAENVLSKAGGILVENKENFACIEAWNEYIKPIREIYIIKARDIIEKDFNEETTDFLESHDRVFIKTKKKGYSICLSTKRIFGNDAELYKIISRAEPNDEMLLSQYYKINSDSYGKKEVRFLVFNNEIINCSRALHSVKHTVSKRFKEAAWEIVDRISNVTSFPQNYVLDIGEFIEKDGNFIDIIEINPITCSLCYVNNSIFDTIVPEIKELALKFGAGYEYCYDLLSNPMKYVYRKSVGENFEYISTNQYILL